MEYQRMMLEAMKEAEYVLIGIGEEWTPSFEEMLLDAEFSENMALIPDSALQDFAFSMLKKKYLKKFHSEQIETAYHNLYEICKEKKYFLISLNQDKYPILSGFEQEKCVFPCGNYDFLQCEKNCQNSLLDAEKEYAAFFLECRGKSSKEYVFPKCPFCHAPLVFNRVEAEKYCEGGYLEQWQSYMNFLTNTVNRSLCILELGVSLRYPGIIRNAFEKTMLYNRKAKLFRIHHSLADVSELIQNRSYVKKENSVYYMSNLFVS